MRLFFALWPDEHVRAALAGWTAACHAAAGGRAVRAANLHMTLAFLGEVEESRLQDLQRIAERAAGESFTLDLVAVRYWRRNGIVYAEPAEVPAALHTLAASLRAGLAAAAFPVEERPFAAHATLLRDARRDPVLVDVPAIRWTVDSMVLVRSGRGERGVEYRPLRRWTLGDRTDNLPAARR